MPKVKDTDRQKLADMEEKLNEIRSNNKSDESNDLIIKNTNETLNIQKCNYQH